MAGHKILADSSALEAALALTRKCAAEYEAAQLALSELDNKLAAASIDDPATFDKLASERIVAERNLARLGLAARESEKREAEALLQHRREQQAHKIARALKGLDQRNAIGAELEAAVAQVAKLYASMSAATTKARDLLGDGLLGTDAERMGMALGDGELERLLAREIYRANPTLPGGERTIRLDGVPRPYGQSDDIPSLSANLKAATELVRAIVHNERDFAGRDLGKKDEKPAKATSWLRPWRSKTDAKIDEAREQGTAPINVTAERATHEREQAVAREDLPRPGESEGAHARRLAAAPITPLTPAEREALKPSGPTRSAAEVQAELNARGKYSTKIDGTGRFSGEDW